MKHGQIHIEGMMPIGVEFKPAEQALYIRLRSGEIEKTEMIPGPGESGAVDRDIDGRILGVEILLRDTEAT